MASHAVSSLLTFATEAITVVVALGLLVLLRLVLPKSSAPAVRQSAIFLGLHVLLRLVLPYLPEGTTQARVVSLAALILLLLSLARSGVLLVFEVILPRRGTRRVPRIFRDIVQGISYVVLLFVALETWGVNPASLLTTSALLTAAVALSLQETLGNLVAGLAIQGQRPFDVDDWIQFDPDPKKIGRVIEINWRATKVVTLDEIEVIVPNAILAKAPILNFTKPSIVSRRSIYVQTPMDIPPHLVRRTMLKAIAGSHGVVDEPPPSVVTNGFVEGNVEYWLRFFSDRFGERDGVDGAARDRIWYAFARANIPIVGPKRRIRIREESIESRAQDAAVQAGKRKAALATVDFLRALSEEQRSLLAEDTRIHLYEAGETVVRQGEESAEMFIVQSGELVVLRERSRGRGTVEVGRLVPGQFFGEMALMTGSKRIATVRAVTPCTLLGVDQDALRTILETAPEVAEHISKVVAERHHAAAELDDEVAPESVEGRQTELLGRIRKFFSL